MFLIEPLALAVNFEAGAIDRKMQRFRAIDPFQLDCLTAPAADKGRMIGDGDIDREIIGDDGSGPSA